MPQSRRRTAPPSRTFSWRSFRGIVPSCNIHAVSKPPYLYTFLFPFKMRLLCNSMNCSAESLQNCGTHDALLEDILQAENNESAHTSELANETVADDSEENDENTTYCETTIGIRNLTENRELISVLDSIKYRIDSLQREINCCGMSDSNDWINIFSGRSPPAKKTNFFLWWSETSRINYFPPSCCPETDTLCGYDLKEIAIVSTNYTVPVVRGCLSAIAQLINRYLKILSGCTIMCIFVHIILNILCYITLERNRRLSRLKFMLKWQHDLNLKLESAIESTTPISPNLKIKSKGTIMSNIPSRTESNPKKFTNGERPGKENEPMKSESKANSSTIRAIMQSVTGSETEQMNRNTK
ncbi:hypothetical protein AB6A40_001191 [Gnathostoma spinigerum]|uniref:Uncharacterized protein n=1 Tax=Gnathostoma spinigerum TaxID=75299 RepID=A0ABD6EDB0_9BILA